MAQWYPSIPYKIRVSICAILISYLRNSTYFVGSYKGGALNKSLYYKDLKHKKIILLSNFC